MPVEDPLSDKLACPRCDRSPLTRDGDKHRCDACKVDFPAVGGIPWMFAEPDYALGEWRNRLHFVLRRLGQDLQHIDTELKSDGLHTLTRKRLELQRNALAEHRETMNALLEPMAVQDSPTRIESFLALRTRLPPDQGLHTYYPNIHRDWAWGAEENQASLEQVVTAMGADHDIGDTLVLGAGACRLAYDLHMQCGAESTIAMDFNPLLLLVAARITGGETLELHEFPMAPKRAEDTAVRRRLSADRPVREGFRLVFGDVPRPPFAAAAFDTVVTPWLIDIVDENLAILSARINKLLKPDGRWLNFGSLTFAQPAFARRHGPAETLAIVAEHGFDTPAAHEATIPYMCSPASRHGRRETVFAFSARKNSDIPAPPRHKALPDWLVTGRASVPLTQSFRTQAATTRIYAYVMSLIDGKRSIEDMAKIMEQHKLMTRKEAEPAIRSFLTRMYDDSRRQTGF